ncbi:MAG: hypothetical protein US49_C0005G0012 [candidate division TM6 bacterium GW2011_GWF2_37_49]|nr:MAG: hypothetical protein US49_C0005G0012 [candidate division TM6 bacterium GW2011_GWF2_37_49]
MNKILICAIVFIVTTAYSQPSDTVNVDASIDFNKVNCSQTVEKSLFAGIESTMKGMEDNILKLMRELGELKMQMQELKTKVKKKLDSQQDVVEIHEQEPADDTKTSAVATVDKVIIGTTSSVDSIVTSSVGAEVKHNLPFNDISNVVVQPKISDN